MAKYRESANVTSPVNITFIFDRWRHKSVNITFLMTGDVISQSALLFSWPASMQKISMDHVTIIVITKLNIVQYMHKH